MAVVVGFIGPEFAPEDICLVAPQFLGVEIDFMEFLVCLEFRLFHHYLDVLQLQTIALFQVTRWPKRVSR